MEGLIELPLTNANEQDTELVELVAQYLYNEGLHHGTKAIAGRLVQGLEMYRQGGKSLELFRECMGLRKGE